MSFSGRAENKTAMLLKYGTHCIVIHIKLITPATFTQIICKHHVVTALEYVQIVRIKTENNIKNLILVIFNITDIVRPSLFIGQSFQKFKRNVRHLNPVDVQTCALRFIEIF